VITNLRGWEGGSVGAEILSQLAQYGRWIGDRGAVGDGLMSLFKRALNYGKIDLEH